MDRNREVQASGGTSSYTLSRGLLKPFTKYALYLETFDIRGGTFKSDVINIRTAVSGKQWFDAVISAYHRKRDCGLIFPVPRHVFAIHILQ